MDPAISEMNTSHNLVHRMPQLTEALDKEDDWTGLKDAKSRRKIQNRLNVRAYRRRKAVAVSQALRLPYWIENEQRVSMRVVSTVTTRTPIIPNLSERAGNVVFPLCPDHLITLLQYNVLRALLANQTLVSALSPIQSYDSGECSSAAIHVQSGPALPGVLPESLQPTQLQCTIPHEGWVDIIPHPIWRDNILRALGKFDEDELWSDSIGGLFEGFPASELEQRGVIAWSPPWDARGWEISEGFWQKWGWSLKGCDEVLAATNYWRGIRGEERLAVGQ